MRATIVFIVMSVFVAICTPARSPKAFTVISEDLEFTVRPLMGGLSRPWAVAVFPNGDCLVTERTGSLLLIKGENSYTVSGLPQVAVVQQGGLLDILLSPSFHNDSWVYFTYVEGMNGLYGTAVARGKLFGISGTAPRLENVEVIYRAQPKSSGGVHFGSRLAFDNDGYLYVTLGERGSMNRAQDVQDPYGSVLRLHTDGSVPTDNPYGLDALNVSRGAPEIWSYGHRNAQGIAQHPTTGDIWLHEHGPKGGDEVNIVMKGENYGWPITTYGINYDGSTISKQATALGIRSPVIYWTPSIAPSGMTFYTGSMFPSWSGDIFVGALAGKHLRRLVLKGNMVVHQEVLLKNRIGRIREVRTGPDGYIYILTDADSGVLYRLEPVRNFE